MLGLVFFLDFNDSLQSPAYFIFGFNLFFRVNTVVAITAGFFQLLAKIIQENDAAADSRFSIRSGIEQQLPSDFLFGYRFSLHKLLKLLDIFGRIECDTFTFAPITAGTSGFLVVAFQAFGDIVVNDKADVGFVYSHSKSDGCHNHINVFHQEFILISRTGCRVHSGVIGQGFYVVYDKGFS